jgi:hypothetical protein
MPTKIAKKSERFHNTTLIRDKTSFLYAISAGRITKNYKSITATPLLPSRAYSPFSSYR